MDVVHSEVISWLISAGSIPNSTISSSSRAFAVGEDPHVAAVGDDHARLARLLEESPQAGKWLRLGINPDPPAAVLRRRDLRRGQCRAEGNAPLGHQPEHLGVAAVTVLDRRDPGLGGPPH